MSEVERGALNRGLKLIKQLIRVLECILERHIRQRVEIDEMQCRFMSGHGGTTVAVFILSQLQKLLLTSNKPFYVTFINILEGQQVGSVHAFKSTSSWRN